LLEEGRGLVGPHADARVVDEVLEDLNTGPIKAPTEITGRGGIGNAACAQGVEKNLVVAEQFEVFQAAAATQRQVGQGADMVGLMIGKVDFQQVQALVDGFDQSALLGERVEGADAADGDAARAFGNLLMDVAGGHNRSGTTAEVGFIQTALDAALAVSQFFA
jgi:hypothetical protein